MQELFTEEILLDLGGLTLEEVEQRCLKYPQEIKRITRIPLGYKQKGGDPNLLVVDPVVLLFLDVTLDQLDNGISFRESADYFNSRMEKHGFSKSITHMGLKKIRAKHRPDAPKRMEMSRGPKPKRLSKEQRFKEVRKRKIASAKREIIAREKRLKKLEAELKPVEEFEDQVKKDLKSNIIQYTEVDYSEIEDLDQSITVFKPEPGPQTAFLQASEIQILYGGAAGGGKSYALLADPMRFFGNKNFSGLLVRRTLEELRELKWKSRELYSGAFPGAKFKEQTSSWVFPSGATLWMSYLERDEDALRYQGQSFAWIGFDELTQWPTPFAWNYLFSRLRSTDPELSQNLSMRATTNPGGPGHGWVKKMFIDPAPPSKSFWATDIETDEVLKYPETYHDRNLAGQPLFKRRFIPAKLSDNSYLWSDGIYERNLMALPEAQRRQLLEGNWDVADGAAFSEFRTNIHTCDPFPVPSNWRRFRSCDWGYSTRQQTAIHWFAIAPDDTLYVYREKIVNQMTATEVARMIMQIERENNDRVSYGVLDANAWNKTGQSGPSIAEEMIKAGCRWRPADNKIQHSRAHGANRLHEVLRVRETPDGPKPGIIFFNTCRKIISTLPILPQDPDGTDDIDSDFPDDHAYDSIRYGVMSRPRFENPWVVQEGNRNPHKRYVPQDPIFGY